MNKGNISGTGNFPGFDFSNCRCLNLITLYFCEQLLFFEDKKCFNKERRSCLIPLVAELDFLFFLFQSWFEQVANYNVSNTNIFCSSFSLKCSICTHQKQLTSEGQASNFHDWYSKSFCIEHLYIKVLVPLTNLL